MITGKEELKILKVEKIFKEINKEQALRHYFSIQSHLQKNENLKLTKRHIEVLVTVLGLPEKYKYSKFSTKARLEVRRLLKEKYNRDVSRGAYQLIIYNLEEKGIIVKNEDEDFDLHPQILEMYNNLKNELEIVIKFEINDN